MQLNWIVFEIAHLGTGLFFTYWWLGVVPDWCAAWLAAGDDDAVVALQLPPVPMTYAAAAAVAAAVVDLASPTWSNPGCRELAAVALLPLGRLWAGSRRWPASGRDFRCRSSCQLGQWPREDRRHGTQQQLSPPPPSWIGVAGADADAAVGMSPCLGRSRSQEKILKIMHTHNALQKYSVCCRCDYK